MISILATVDGSPAALAVIPTVERLAHEIGAKITLLTVVERPKATIARRGEVAKAPFANVATGQGGGETASARRAQEPQWVENDDQALQRAVAEGHDFLETAAKPLRARQIKVETEVVVEHAVADAIVHYAKDKNFDLIAMSTHGRSGLRSVVQGSVASAVVRAGVVPVLLIRPSKTK